MKFILSICVLIICSTSKAKDVEIAGDIKSSFGHKAIIAEYRTSKGIDKTHISISFANYQCIKDAVVIDIEYENIEIKWISESDIQIKIPKGFIVKNLAPSGLLNCGEQEVGVKLVIGLNV